MTPEQFVTKWKAADLKERAAAQSHFNDLCELLDEPKPTDADPKGEWYCFERGATKTTGGEGWADVWKRGCFGWEYKSRGRNLDEAVDQLKRYALALENPPLLIACNLDRFRIVTNWTNAVSARHEFDLDGLREPANRDKLKWAFAEPERLRPGLTRRHVTEIAAEKFAGLATDLRAKGHEPQTVAHFINRLVFCMFAEDISLLPNAMFTRMLKEARRTPAEFEPLCRSLFAAMQTGGRLGLEHVEWFNGGLFDDDTAFPLSRPEIERALDAAAMDWSQIDPSIMGTLFERGLDPDKRSQLGAHYTDAEKIMKIIEPVIQRPLEAEWAEAKAKIEEQLARAQTSKSASARTRAHNEASKLFRSYLDRLRRFRVLDPACGSGNFLYLALQTLKDLEHRISIEAEALGLPREFPQVGPEQLLGIEINPYAAELARVSVWIGEIQWMQRNGFGVARNPILRPLDTIECRDAILNPDGTESEWPETDVIIGNPPFLGMKELRQYVPDEYVNNLRAIYKKSVPATADLFAFWFAKANQVVQQGRAAFVGLVAKNTITQSYTRSVLSRIAREASLFCAWTNQPWVVEGAAVEVHLICFGSRADVHGRPTLDGTAVSQISAELRSIESRAIHLSRPSVVLSENLALAFQGVTPLGNFFVGNDGLERVAAMPLNPNGRPNADVLKRCVGGDDLTGRDQHRWLIDFGVQMPIHEAMLYEEPFQHIVREVKPLRDKQRRDSYRKRWWIHAEARPGLRRRIALSSRYITTSLTAKHRLFVWMPTSILPLNTCVAITRDDDTVFGVLSSHIHVLWSTRHSGKLEDRPRYTPSTTFETFPFPHGLTPSLAPEAYADDPRAQRIATAARRLNALREAWLNPPDLVVRVPEIVPGYPDRILPRDEAAAKELRKRTLTNLYNQRPAWLDNIHKDLDAAVAAAYGWPADLSDDEILKRLFELNQERAGGGGVRGTSECAAVA